MKALHRVLPMLTAAVLVFACCTSFVHPALGRGPQRGSLVETGDFHGDEVHARSGQRWLGLYVSNSGSKLVDVPVTVSRVPDILALDDTDRKGKRIQTPGHSKPLFLVRGCPRLKAGDVTTVLGAETALTDRSDMTLRLGSDAYRLWVSTPSHSESGAIENTDVRLLLSMSGTQQEIYSLRNSTYLNEPSWSVLWAGDLDGDGRLDLYLSLGAHYNEVVRLLLLSTDRSPGRLVCEAARLRLTGC
jgi:hypothetical protein